MHNTILKYISKLANFADLKHTNSGAVLEIQLQHRLLPTPYTHRLAVCQQVPTENGQKEENTHSLFENEFESNSPFLFFFLYSF